MLAVRPDVVGGRRVNRFRAIAGLLVLGVAGVCDGIGYALLPNSHGKKLES